MTQKTDSDPTLDLGAVTLVPGARIGSYAYERPVGTGGMAHVLLARDPGGEPVALKMLKANRVESGRQRFVREFRALRKLRHENVIRVDAAGEFHGHPYIVMEYVEGRDLHAVIRAMAPLSPDQRFARCTEILIDMTKALTYIHKCGLVHRDLKPSNILIAPDGTAKLTDFGIVKDLDPSSNYDISTTLVGTWAYASPEQISGAPIDHRSDLYSLGVLLYAMLTGRRPFVANDLGGYLEQHRNRVPTPPTELDPNVPDHLEEICLRLLEKAPRERYQGAREILVVLERHSPENTLDRAPPPTAETEAPQSVWQPPLVGRQDALQTIHDTVSALTRGDGSVLLVEGREGTGRSRMFKVARKHAEVIGLPVYATRLSEREGSFDAVLRLANSLNQELGARTPAELNRVLSSFRAGADEAAGDLRYQLYDALRAALALLLMDGPVVLAVDDLHHARPVLLGLLAFLSRTLIEREGFALLVLATLQEGPQSPGLKAFREGSEMQTAPKRITLRPLASADIEMLVGAVLGTAADARAIARRLIADLGGNPLLVAEHLRGELYRRRDADSIDHTDEDTALIPLLAEQDTEVLAAPDLSVPDGLRHALAARLKGLSLAERDVISVLAAAGREFDLDVLLDVVLDESGAGSLIDSTRLPTSIDDLDGAVVDTDDADEALSLIEDLVEKGILIERRVGLRSMVDFAHRRLAEVVYGELSDNRRAHLHRRIAHAMESRERENPLAAETMAEHFRLAGDAGRAYDLLAVAAAGLQKRTLLAEAWRLSESAKVLEFTARKELAAATFEARRNDLLQVRGEVLYNQGRWIEANECFSKLYGAALEVGDADLASTSGLRMGECIRRLGRDQEAEELIQHLLTQARAAGDRPTIVEALRRLATFAFEEGDFERCERYATEGLVAAVGPKLAAARAGILIALSVTQASRGELAAATSGLSEAEDILRKLRRKRATSIVLGNLAELLLWQGRHADALARLDEGLKRAADVLYVGGEAFLLRVKGVALFHVGDLDGATAALHRSLKACREVSDRGEMAAVHYSLAHIALRRGKVDEALATANEGLEFAALQDTEDYAPVLQVVRARALCAQGKSTEGKEALEAVVSDLDSLFLPRRTQVELEAAHVWAALGYLDRALPLARKAAHIASSRGFQSWALQARLLLSEIAPEAEAEAACAEAAVLARSLVEGLAPEQVKAFRRQPRLARLWVYT